MTDPSPAAPPSPGLAGKPRAGLAPFWIRWLIKIGAYFSKEVSEIRRQPLLILSLIIGPLLVLIIFGASYQNSTPLLRTAIVLPAEGLPGISEQLIRDLAGLNFQLEQVTTDRAAAEADLAAGRLEVVQVLPGDFSTTLRQGEIPRITFLSNAINPLVEGWIQYLAYAEVNEINKAILRQLTVQAQLQAEEIKRKVVAAEDKISRLEEEIPPEEQLALRRDLAELLAMFERLEEFLPAAAVLASQEPELAELPAVITQLQDELQSIDQDLIEGRLDEATVELRTALSDLRQLDAILASFVAITPDRLVSPVAQNYVNIKGNAYAAVIYYSPGVLALLVQHTAITLGALALVRERLMGAFEVFRVAPVNMIELLIGKYLGYTFFISLSSAVLIGAMILLGVPLLGSWQNFTLLLLLLTVASLGVGFLISTVSGSDSQAIQLAMISLLLSIFFSGFFIALDSFATPALAVSYLIPMTHGLAGFQQLMLRGLDPTPLSWIALALIAFISFTLVVILTRRQFKNA